MRKTDYTTKFPKTAGRRAKALFLLLVLLVSMTAASCAEQTVEITLKPGDTYYFEDHTPLADGAVFETGDDTIAEVVSGQYIWAHSPGETEIRVKTKDGTVTYRVTVTSEEEYRDIITIPYIWDLNVKDTRDLTVYLGSGVNMITCSGLPSLDDLITSQNILSINSIKKLVQSGDNKILRDKSVVSNYLNIYGTSAQEYSDSYKREISGALGVGVGNNLIGLKAELSLASDQTKEELENSLRADWSILTLDTMYIYTLNTSVSELTELAKTNSLAWRRLTGELNTSVADFVRMYGTHIVVKSMVGGRTQLDFSLVADASKVSQSQFQELTASVTVNALFFDETLSLTHTSGSQSSDVKNYLTASFCSNAYGGSYPAIGSITEPENFADAYGEWYETLNDETAAFIAPAQLLPVWELLPKDQYAERIQEFQDYYNQFVN